MLSANIDERMMSNHGGRLGWCFFVWTSLLPPSSPRAKQLLLKHSTSQDSTFQWTQATVVVEETNTSETPANIIKTALMLQKYYPQLPPTSKLETNMRPPPPKYGSTKLTMQLSCHNISASRTFPPHVINYQ